MIFYCPACWREVPGNPESCPSFGEDLTAWSEKDYSAKLFAALSHPEPETQKRAVHLLGERGAREAAEALVALFRGTTDLFLQCEVVEALGKIGGGPALSLLMQAPRHPAFLVRGKAVNALARFEGEKVLGLLRKMTLEDSSQYVRETAKAALARKSRCRK